MKTLPGVNTFRQQYQYTRTESANDNEDTYDAYADRDNFFSVKNELIRELALNKHATHADIKKAFNRFVLANHPDLAVSEQDKIERNKRIQKINHLWDAYIRDLAKKTRANE